MDKQKEIEEIKELLKAKAIIDFTCVDELYVDKYEALAKIIYEQGYQKINKDSVSTSKEKVFDILNKFEFFQGQRAGRELWNDKLKEVQDQDITDFVKGINYIRAYLQDSVVLTKEEYQRDFSSQFNKGFQHGSKETARKILKEAKELDKDFEKTGLYEYIMANFLSQDNRC